MVLTPLAFAAGNASAGKDKALVHRLPREDGNSLYPECPKLAGQLENYIFKQAQDFKTGKRQDDIMTGDVYMGEYMPKRFSNSRDLIQLSFRSDTGA